MKLLVGEKTLAIAVIILEEEILVVSLENAIVELDDGVIVLSLIHISEPTRR